MAEVSASSPVDTGKASRLAGMSFTSKLPSQDTRNSFSRCGHLQRVLRGEGGRKCDGLDLVAFVHLPALSIVSLRLGNEKQYPIPIVGGFLQPSASIMPVRLHRTTTELAVPRLSVPKQRLHSIRNTWGWGVTTAAKKTTGINNQGINSQPTSSVCSTPNLTHFSVHHHLFSPPRKKLLSSTQQLGATQLTVPCRPRSPWFPAWTTPTACGARAPSCPLVASLAPASRAPR